MLDKLKKRRTQYALGKNLPIPETQVDSLIREAIRLSPSSFNSQSSRAVCGSFVAFSVWVDGTYFLPGDRRISVWLQGGRDSTAEPVFELVNTIVSCPSARSCSMLAGESSTYRSAPTADLSA